MATYTIVDKDKDPLDPGEVNAGSDIPVSDGDVFIIDPSANANVTFEAAGGNPASFDVVINESNANNIDLKFENDLSPSVTVADDVSVPDFKIDAKDADAIDFTAGDNVSFGDYDGSDGGVDTITIGNGFTSTKNWKTSDGDDIITVGDNASFRNIDTGEGDDSLTFGDGATVRDMSTKDGDDTVRFGDDLDARNIKTGKGDDSITIGADAVVTKIDGGAGNDTLTTQTEGLNTDRIENTNVVCFARGTRIETLEGGVAVENLKPGDLVRTADNGYQPLRWIGSIALSAEELRSRAHLRPIRISAGALGRDLPRRDLLVSPQHRILIRSAIAERMFGSFEIFVIAKKLVQLPGIDIVEPGDGVAYFHILFDRHEVVFAEGASSESLFLGAQAVAALDAAALLEIEALSMTMRDAGAEERLARPCPKNGARLKRLLERHVRNRKDVVVPAARPGIPEALEAAGS